MRIAKTICLLMVAMMMCGVLSAQRAKYTSLEDSTAVNYLRGGYVRDRKLHLMAKEEYSTLDLSRKKTMLNKIAYTFPKMDITVYSKGQKREVWIASDAGVILMEEWDNDNPQLENYMPLELKRNGNSKVFYYVGGSFNKAESYSNGSLNLRVGTYLFQNTADLSATYSLGYVKTEDTTQLSSSIGIDARYYLPYRPQKVNITPYVGGGIAWTFAPEQYFELRMLAGVCWFIGSGSLDAGLQYGIKSGFTATIGYTIRPGAKKRK
jgi:hypothetical protein